MLEHRPIVELTVDQARVLLAPDQARALLGVDLAELPPTGSVRLIEALATAAVPAPAWTARLAGVTVPLLDVNRAPADTLRRIPGLAPAQAEQLVRLRPYFSLADLVQEGADLAAMARLAAPYLSHEGYEFLDKPAGRLVRLRPHPDGLLLRYRIGMPPPTLTEAGLVTIAQDPGARLLACRWTIPLEQRAGRRRVLKTRAAVETVAPFLAGEDGQVRAPYPDRLDLALRPDSDPARWEAVLATHQLSVVHSFMPGFGSVRLTAHPHDLGALYRTLRALAREPAVRFVEPTYLALDTMD